MVWYGLSVAHSYNPPRAVISNPGIPGEEVLLYLAGQKTCRSRAWVGHPWKLKCNDKNLIDLNGFHYQYLQPCHLTCFTCDLMKNDPSFIFLRDCSDSLNSVCAFRSVYSIQAQLHVCWQFVVSVLKLGVSHGWIFIQQLSHCGQVRISKSYLACVKSVQPAINQPLHLQGNIMWHLSKTLAACHSPHTIVLQEKQNLSCGSHLFVQSMLRLGYFYISTGSRSKSCTEKFNWQICKQSHQVSLSVCLHSISQRPLFILAILSNCTKACITHVFASKCQPRKLYFCHISY